MMAATRIHHYFKTTIHVKTTIYDLEDHYRGLIIKNAAFYDLEKRKIGKALKSNKRQMSLITTMVSTECPPFSGGSIRYRNLSM